MRSQSIRRTTTTSSSAPTTAASSSRKTAVAIGRTAAPMVSSRVPLAAWNSTPQQPRRVYAGSFTGGGFFKSEDYGKHWSRRLFGGGQIYVAGVAVDPVDH